MQPTHLSDVPAAPAASAATITRYAARRCPKTQSPAMTRKTAFTPEATRKAAEALRNFWRAGDDSLRDLDALQRKRPAAYGYGTKQNVLRAAAAKAGYNPDTMKKAWRAAREYTEADIDRLCRLVERHAARFGPSHLIRLMTVKDRARRAALTEAAIEGRWGVTELMTALLRRRRRRPDVGKRPRLPADPAGRLVALEGLCLRWTRWCEAALPGLRGDLRAAVRRATRAVGAVSADVAKRRQRPGPGGGRKAKRP